MVNHEIYEKAGVLMQVNISQTHETEQAYLGNPTLLYVGSLENRDLMYPRNAHAHPNIVEFIYILNGSGEYEIANRRYPISKDDLIIYDSNVVHYEFADNQKIPILFCAAAGIQRPGMKANCILDPQMDPVFHIGKDQRLIYDLLRKMLDTALLGSKWSDAVCQSLFLSFLHLVIDAVDQGDTAAETRKTPSNHFGQEIRAYVDMQPVNCISVSQIAEKFGISESYLARVFKRSFGYTLIEYMVRRRIGEAQTLLVTTDLSVMEIGECVGYQSQSYFAKAFSDHVGLSPLRYRKMYREQKKR